MATAQHALELELVQQLSSSEEGEAERALELIYQRYGAALLGFASYVTGSRSTGARLVAATFIGLARTPPDVAGPHPSVRAHLFGSALAACMAEVRPPTRRAPARSVEDNRLGLLVQLPLDERVPVALAHFGKLTYAEIAAMLGVKPDKVRRLMERGLRRLLR